MKSIRALAYLLALIVILIGLAFDPLSSIKISLAVIGIAYLIRSCVYDEAKS